MDKKLKVPLAKSKSIAEEDEDRLEQMLMFANSFDLQKSEV